MEEFPDDFGFIDWNKEFDFETTLGEGSGKLKYVYKQESYCMRFLILTTLVN